MCFELSKAGSRILRILIRNSAAKLPKLETEAVINQCLFPAERPEVFADRTAGLHIQKALQRERSLATFF